MFNKNHAAPTYISGWSNTDHSLSYLKKPSAVSEIPQIIREASEGRQKILARGAGQSYGDQALNADQLLIDMTSLKKIISWDPASGLLEVEVGATYSQILSLCLKDCWTLPVIPGTRFVTIGGALSNNVHGKNSLARGNFGEWVKEFKIIIASGEICTCSRENNSDLFFGAIGGAGLLGVVTKMTLQLVRIPSPYLSVQKSTAPELISLMDILDKAVAKHEFGIIQVDCFPIGKNLGRGTLHSADFTETKNTENDFEKMATIDKKILGLIPKKWALGLGKYFLNNFTMRIISAIKYHLEKNTSDKPRLQNIFEFIFFLDKMPNWKKVFKYGFFEYEPLIPKHRARQVIPKLIHLTHIYGMPAYLSAVKVHRKDNFLLSYSLDGYSFAMDIPRRPDQKEKQEELFRKMNQIVIESDGIVYLAKDATLTPDEFRKMYPNLDQFLALKNKYDPNEVFQSDMYRRIFKPQ